MREIKWVFVFFAFAAFLSICGIGVAIGAESIFGLFISIVLLFFIMGFGFKTKKRYREEGRL
ncbi:YlaF family protein [Heyndrickxia ginsengihumi]|uniref:YlaF family protein n=1 Tax=Heyndrickxia ginsengihumi TaxID=363870 RepID=A0A0A6V9V7_9BACI|nr:YlaF family protein [Heyndrickxia ginsengihumi]KHD84298.1 hypothetical protein NG54_16455 [Heyndrickxia ginsengihumi]MBE6183659.1 hypothetical protein [Bacillus sp. (in: firmicutes)]MCM3022369.1 YlaF family protein [Heyndrickxia ginsengihumi]NEY18689.1 YlaF family protein [Heyndrickxia ginsengihumi]